MITPGMEIFLCFSLGFALVYSREVKTSINTVDDDRYSDGYEPVDLRYNDEPFSGDVDRDDNNAMNAIETDKPDDKETFDYLSNDSELPLVGKIPGKKNIGKFTPIRMPTEFESYDINPTDGYITLSELVAVTGAKENVQLAFKDSDIDGDGRLTKGEFLKAPWTLQGFVSNNVEDLIKVENQIIKEERVLKKLVEEMEESNDTDAVDKLKKALEEQKQNEIEIESEIRKQLYDNEVHN